ncbi:MAG TPA: hypothetical protein VEU96_08950 [Bryobacteraceae bacterium]|nr:hypothetical protein [Bryobacteraceae bacterium]
MDALEREDQEDQARLAVLRAAIDEGDASGVAEGDVFARVREKLKMPKPRRKHGQRLSSRVRSVGA